MSLSVVHTISGRVRSIIRCSALLISLECTTCKLNSCSASPLEIIAGSVGTNVLFSIVLHYDTEAIPLFGVLCIDSVAWPF